MANFLLFSQWKDFVHDGHLTHTLRCFPEFLGRRCRRMASRGAFVHRGAVVVDGLGAAEARGAETWRT